MRPEPDMRITADLVFPSPKVVVFIDGCFWHGCPTHYREPKSNADYWRSKIARNKARDKTVNEVLAAAGWLVLRYWSHEEASEVADRIELNLPAGTAGRPSRQ